MTLEQGYFSGDQDYVRKQQILSRILRKLREEDLPGAPYGEQYFQNLYRRNAEGWQTKQADRNKAERD